jgi:hypothetical protein
VLVAGGSSATAAELYDPASDSWALAGATRFRRFDHAAVALADGRVLVVGGSFNGSPGGSLPAELYTPASDSWTLAPLDQRLMNERLTPLADGRVLLTGSTIGGAAAAIFDPATSLFAAVTSPPAIFFRHSAVGLADGRVLLHGQLQPDSYYPLMAFHTLIYNPAANRWTPARGPAERRLLPTLTLLADGQVLIAGGQGSDGLGLASAERYDPSGAALDQSAYLPQVGEPFPTFPPFPTTWPTTAPLPTATPVYIGPAITYIGLQDPAFPESEEYVEIESFANGPLDLTGWQLRNASRPEVPAFVFPSFTLEEDTIVAVFSREGTNDLEIGDFFWGQIPPIWRVGDRAELLDSKGQLVYSYVVPPQ